MAFRDRIRAMETQEQVVSWDESVDWKGLAVHSTMETSEKELRREEQRADRELEAEARIVDAAGISTEDDANAVTAQKTVPILTQYYNDFFHWHTMLGMAEEPDHETLQEIMRDVPDVATIVRHSRAVENENLFMGRAVLQKMASMGINPIAQTIARAIALHIRPITSQETQLAESTQCAISGLPFPQRVVECVPDIREYFVPPSIRATMDPTEQDVACTSPKQPTLPTERKFTFVIHADWAPFVQAFWYIRHNHELIQQIGATATRAGKTRLHSPAFDEAVKIITHKTSFYQRRHEWSTQVICDVCGIRNPYTRKALRLTTRK